MNAVRLVSLLIVLSQVPVAGRAQGCFSLTAEENFEKTIQAQHIPVQQMLGTIIDESAGYLITGPLEPLANYGGYYGWVFTSLRVICPDTESKRQALDAIAGADRWKITSTTTGASVTRFLPGYTGSMLTLQLDDEQVQVQVMTAAELRFLLWSQFVRENGWYQQPADKRDQFALALSDYLATLTDSKGMPQPPQASEYGLPHQLNLYFDSEVESSVHRRNYEQALAACREIRAEVAYGALAFVPGEDGLEQMKRLAPSRLYPDSVRTGIQGAFRTAYEPPECRTLTIAVYDTLDSGRYAFAVSAAGKIRIARMTGETDSDPIHARLLYGERALAAGTIAIDANHQPRLVQMTAGSKYYFGRLLQGCPNDSLASVSDQVFLSLGHLLMSLDGLGVDYSGVLISKF